ncbi:ATP-binding protein [Kribbella sp. CA-253562]|uniref:ATP-binding protein n=1 Tax=Kribbella sp. CA-253562 TaxID=3239942 RepID=UPI003D8B3648
MEREAVIDRMLDAVRKLRTGCSSVVVLSGEAGMGKTSVVRAFVDRLDADIRVLWGGCDDLLAPPALGPLREAFRATDGALNHAIDGGDMRKVLLESVGELSGSRPTVLVLEDLHWADDATIDVIRYIARRLDRLNLLLIVTFRPDGRELRPPLRALLGAITGSSAQRVALEPLSLDAVRSLACGSGRDADGVHALTAGNPFYVAEVLAGPEGTATPLTVVDAVLTRVLDLPPGCRDAVEQMSVVPWPVDLTFAERLLGERFHSLAEAEERGVLEIRSGAVRFRHEIARRVIEEAIPQIRRIAMNRAVVAALLAAADADPAAIVHHAVEASDTDVILKFAPVAARRAARAGSHGQALTCLEAVVPYVDRLAVADRAPLLDAYAWELHIAHRFTDAVKVGEQAVGLREEVGEATPLIETLLRLSRHQYMFGDTPGALATVERAVELSEPLRSPAVRAVTLAYRGMMLVQTGQLDEAVAMLPQARQIAAQAGRTDLVSLCLNYLGVALTDLGDSRGVPYLREALNTALGSGDHESAARAYTNLAEVLFRHDLYEDLETCLDEGRRFTHEHGFWSHFYGLETHQAQLSLRLGDWDDARRRVQELEDSVRQPGMLAVYSMPINARIQVRRGNLQTAHDLLSVAWQRAWQQQSLVGILYSGLAYAEWTWLTGRRDVAQQIGDRLSQYAVPRGLIPSFAEVNRYLSLAGAMVESPATASGGGSERLDPYERAAQLATSGSVAQAVQALNVLDANGAKAAADDLRRQLRRLGVESIPRSSRTRPDSNRYGLTRRHIEVLHLLEKDLTNAEIAKQLVVSVRTVDHHVSAILNRLGAASRKDAVSRAAALGLLVGSTPVARSQIEQSGPSIVSVG